MTWTAEQLEYAQENGRKMGKANNACICKKCGRKVMHDRLKHIREKHNIQISRWNFYRGIREYFDTEGAPKR